MGKMFSTQQLFRSKEFSRVNKVVIGQKEFRTPTFFPAISSYGTRFSINELIKIVSDYSFPRVLLSMYDLANINLEKSEVFSILEDYRNRGIVFIDSGCFESFWKTDSSWTITKYKNYLVKMSCELYTSFDFIPKKQIISLNDIYRFNIDNIIESKDLREKSLFIPIFHTVNNKYLSKMIDKFLYEYPDFSKAIAVTEKECGDDILSIAITIKEIRKAIDKYDDTIILHLLGCGNPLSVFLGSYVGGDSFDSIDWAKFVINRYNLMIYHFSYLKRLSCDCQICSNGKIRNYYLNVLLHNLFFYEQFINGIQNWIKEGTLRKNLRYYFEETFLNSIDKSSY